MMCAISGAPTSRWNVNLINRRLLMPAFLCLCLWSTSGGSAQTSRVFAYNGRIPLGIESFRLQPAGRDFYLMASVENPGFDGLYRLTDHLGHDHLYSTGDKPVTAYPSSVQFRLTASSREKLVDDHPFDTRAKLGVDDLLKQLHFRVKVFHALDYRYVKPTSVEEVGIPNDIPYDERIYQIRFDLGHVPIEDRIVLEVFSPTGERLCKFHLDLL
jgi:hypothetical protein